MLLDAPFSILCRNASTTAERPEDEGSGAASATAAAAAVDCHLVAAQTAVAQHASVSKRDVADKPWRISAVV